MSSLFEILNSPVVPNENNLPTKEVDSNGNVCLRAVTCVTNEISASNPEALIFALNLASVAYPAEKQLVVTGYTRLDDVYVMIVGQPRRANIPLQPISDAEETFFRLQDICGGQNVSCKEVAPIPNGMFQVVIGADGTVDGEHHISSRKEISAFFANFDVIFVSADEVVIRSFNPEYIKYGGRGEYRENGFVIRLPLTKENVALVEAFCRSTGQTRVMYEVGRTCTNVEFNYAV